MSKLVCRFVFLFSVITAVFVSSGLADETITLTQSDSGSSIVLSQGQMLKISLLGSGSDGGYLWEVMPGTESILQQTDKQCVPASFCNPGTVGCPPMCTFIFKAVEAGQGTLKLINHRPWEHGVPPWQTFEVKFTVNGKEVSVPTLSEWGMIVFALFGGLSSVYALMRREIHQP